MEMSNARAAFVQESRELLQAMEEALLAVERDGLDGDSMGAIFRAAHTIKGSAGLFGLDPVVSFTHVLENVFDRLRAGTLAYDPAMPALFLKCGDFLGRMIGAFEEGDDAPDPDPSLRASLLEKLDQCLGSSGVAVQVGRESRVEEAVPAPSGDDIVESDNWHISLRLAPDILRHGMDPVSFLRYLEGMGRIVAMEVVPESLPAWDDFDSETMHLGFEIQYESDASKKQIEDVFEFLSEGARIRIIPPSSKIGQYVALIHEESDPGRLGEILVACGALTPAELERALADQERDADTARPIGTLLVEEEAVHPLVVAAALKQQQKGREKSGTGGQRFLKVDVDKLDALINLVGELVIAGAGAKIAALRAKNVPCEEAVNAVTDLVEDIRDAALGLRMIPVGEVFNRFPRVVRDIASDLGKKIDLEITGAETELDKSMVEKLTDPLTHIVRNAIDHGIESIEDRRAAGKSETGRVHLHAHHESGSILIEITDDGKGLDRDRILAKAVEKGLVEPGQELSESETFRLVFEPGFSTADKITNLSGRGVGMDVVKKNIEQLRGEVDIESRKGQGTTLRIRLPLTLAIIDGFQILVGSASYVVPLDLVKECADLVASDIHGDLVSLRGESLPFIRLRDLFRVPGERPSRESLMVVQYASSRIGLVVDQLAGELQAVIKPLGSLFRDLKAVGGTTILGNGAVALILDVPHLSQVAASRATT